MPSNADDSPAYPFHRSMTKEEIKELEELEDKLSDQTQSVSSYYSSDE